MVTAIAGTMIGAAIAQVIPNRSKFALVAMLALRYAVADERVPEAVPSW